MTSVPASAFVSVNPAVLSAGGSALDLNGLFLTNSSRVPIGTVLSFASAANVATYFGASSNEYNEAAVYFAGFDNSNIKPGALLFAQYNTVAVPAYLRGANVSTLPISTLDALSGTMKISVNGTIYTSGAISLTALGSFSLAAAAIQTAFSTFSGTVTYDSVSGAFLFTTTATGGSETISYITSNGATASACTTASTVMTVGGTVVGAFYVGDYVTGTDGTNTLPAGTTIVNQLTGTTGGAGTYTISAAGAPGNLASFPATAYGPNGVLASTLGLTAATGAVLSQGAAIATPSPAMNSIIANTTNWASFTTLFDPDNGSGNANKVLFATWTSLQNNRYMYVPKDTDITPTQSANATTSLGNILIANASSGTAPIYSPGAFHHAAFICGATASIDFSEKNGNTNLAYKGLASLQPGVTNQTVMSNLIANGYNSYVSAANATNQWNYLFPGLVSGKFLSIQRYVNQIWLNSSFQTALMTLMTNVKAVPYAAGGYALINAAMMDPINAALNFGMIQKGVTISSAEIAEVNSAAGANVATTLQTRGWYLQVLDPGAVVRGGGGSPSIAFWYTDGGGVLYLNVASTDVQ